MSDGENFQASGPEITGSGPFAKNWRLATQSLGDLEQKSRAAGDHDWIGVWGSWCKLRGFPATQESTAADRYVFVDAYLKQALDPLPHPTHPNHYLHLDLNGKNGSQRAWLLNKVLQRLLDEAQPGYREANGVYRLPEDLPKIAEDINLLRKHHGELPSGVSRTL